MPDITTNSPTRLTITHQAIAAASSGNNTLVSAPAGGQKIRVHQLAVIGAGAVNLYFTSNAGGTVIFGGSTNVITIAAAGGGFVLPYSEIGWFETTAGHLLNLNLSGATIVSGGLAYSLVPA